MFSFCAILNSRDSRGRIRISNQSNKDEASSQGEHTLLRLCPEFVKNANSVGMNAVMLYIDE